MKLNLKSLLKDKNVLYVVLFIAITNLFAYLMRREFDAIVFFLVVGFLSSYFSKNMIIIMLIAILSTNFLIGTKLLGKAVKEGMTSNDDNDKKNVLTLSKNGITTIEGDKELLRYVDVSGYFFKKEPLKRTYPKFVEPEPIKPLTPKQLKELGITPNN